MPVSEAEISDQFATLVHDEGLITNTSTMSPFWRLINTLVTRPVRWLNEALIHVTLKTCIWRPHPVTCSICLHGVSI